MTLHKNIKLLYSKLYERYLNQIEIGIIFPLLILLLIPAYGIEKLMENLLGITELSGVFLKNTNKVEN
jgi:hypothetical protein